MAEKENRMLLIDMFNGEGEIIEELFANDWQSFAEMMDFYFSDKEFIRMEITRLR